MKRSFVFLLVLMLAAVPAWAEACSSCGDKNHYNIHNNYGGKGGNASASVTSITQQWMAQSQSMNIAPGAFKSTVTTGPTNVTTGPTNVDLKVSVAGGGSGGGGEVSGYLIQNFPAPFVPEAANPLTYNGSLKESQYADDQIWFSRTKWTEDMMNNMPSGGTVTDAIFEKTQPVKYFYVKDGRKDRQWCEDTERDGLGVYDKGKCAPYSPQGYFVGNVYCDSDGPKDKPGLVWGSCGKRFIVKGCTYAVLKSAVVNQGVLSNATNQSGGLSFAGIFGAIFGFNAGGGASNTDHKASAYEILNMTWACYAVQPTTTK
jgi:hypothetical protein